MRNQYLPKAWIIGFSIISTCSCYVWSLETIVVSDTRFDSSIYDSASIITVITEEDIRLMGIDHVVDALRNSGGIQVSDLFGDGTDANIGMRGFSSSAGQNTLIMIDGRRMNNTDNGLPDLNALSVNDIEKIELVKSSMSTLYGDKAVGGVINVITKKPNALRIQANARYGSFNNRAINGAIENSHDNGIDYRISIQRHLTDNYRDNNQLELTTLNTRTGYHYDSGHLFLEFQGAKEKIHLPGALFNDLLIANPTQALNPEDVINTDTTAGRFGIQHLFNDSIEFRLEFTNRFNDISGTISSAGNAEIFTSKRHHTEWTPRVTFSFNLLEFATDLYVGIDSFETDYVIQSRFGLTDNTQSQYGYYGRMITSITEQVKLITGARHGVVKNDILVDTLSFGRSLPEGTELDDTANAFEVGITYQLKSNWRLFSKIENNFRFVTADEYSAIADNNFFSQLFGFGTPVPLPETQRGLSLEAGAGWQSDDNSHLSLQIYRLDIDNEIVFDPVLFLNTNLGNTRRNGLIVEGRYSFSNDISFSGSYSYLDAKFTSGKFDGNELTFLPTHSVRASINYAYNDHAGIYVEWLGQDKRRFDGDYTNEFQNLPGYSLFNFNARYDFERIQLSFQINNILGKRYSDSGIIGFDFRQPFPSPVAETYYPAPGRNVMLSLSYNH